MFKKIFKITKTNKNTTDTKDFKVEIDCIKVEEHYDDDYWSHPTSFFFDEYEKCYDWKLRKYKFNHGSCPLTLDDDASYCHLCTNYRNCFNK